ncbi:MAG TPA: energy transducer TonB [Candidatus Acidoferrum sp.]|nr:energy transducer TonB [Candidatus Acidoferrum sp.]
MRTSAQLVTACLFAGLVNPGSAHGQIEIANPAVIARAKTIYFEDKSGVDAVGQRVLTELAKWGRFQVVKDRKRADLILVLETDPDQGGDLILAGGQTATIDPGGHVAEDPIPNYNKQAPVHYAFLSVVDAQSGRVLWSDSHRWGGLLTGFNSVGERLVKEFEQREQVAERAASLKLINSADPIYPEEVSKQHVQGSVVVKIVVGKDGSVISAKALTGPPELRPASEEAAMRFHYEPPRSAPVASQVELTYGLLPKLCPQGAKGDHGEVYYAEKLPMTTERPGELQVVSDIDVPLPPYPETARAAGIQGDVDLFITVAPSGNVIGVRVVKSVDSAIDEAAVTAVRSWKFRVTRGETGSFPIRLFFRMTCGTENEK